MTELTFRRIHQATPELLFDCMTTPEHLAHFWGPTGTTTVSRRLGKADGVCAVADIKGAAKSTADRSAV